MKKVIWTPTARKSLQETLDFITELWDEHVGDQFLNQLNYRIAQIQKNPELASPFKNSSYRKLVIHKSVSLFYRNHSDHIKLLLIWDNRQNPEELFRKIDNANK